MRAACQCIRADMDRGARAEHSGELTGIDARVRVINLLGQNGARRQMSATLRRVAGHGRDARIVGRLRQAALDRRRDDATAGEHHVGAPFVVVLRVRKRTHQRPAIGTFGQSRQVFADLHAGRLRGDRAELAPILDRAVGLHVERVVLRRSAGQEDINHRLGFGGRLTSLGRRRAPVGDVGERQSQESDGSGLHGLAAGETGVPIDSMGGSHGTSRRSNFTTCQEKRVVAHADEFDGVRTRSNWS